MSGSSSISSSQEYLSISVEIFASKPGFGGQLLQYKLNIHEKEIVTKICEYILPLAKHRWHMGVAMTTLHDNCFIVCGDRRGSVILYKEGVPEHMDKQHGVHGKHGVTSVNLRDRVVTTTGRDGSWRTFQINEDEKLQMFKQKRALSGMDWLSLTICRHDTLFIGGFHGNDFVLWSSASGDILFNVTCGGGHRSWDFNVTNETSMFAFIKGQDICMAKIEQDVTNEYSVVEPSSHGRQISCTAYLGDIVLQNDQIGYVFATGSEDTKIDINICYKEAGLPLHKIEILHTLDDHVSSIRTLSSTKYVGKIHNNRILLFSAGARTSLNCYAVNLSHYETFSKSVNLENELYCIGSACSDGIVRIYTLNHEAKDIKLTYASNEGTHCFLTISQVHTKNHKFIVTGSTNGNLEFWMTGNFPNKDKPNDTLQCCFKNKLHQSGINSLAFTNAYNSKLNKELVLIATGGDDNSITLILFNVTDLMFNMILKKEILNAHSTQITGLKFSLNHKQNLQSSKFFLVSTSIDQRVIKWKIVINFEPPDIKYILKDSLFTNISDVSGLEIIPVSSHNHENLSESFKKQSELYVICGQGLCIISD